MFSGRYPAETGVESNALAPIDAACFPMMGTLFKNAGYATLRKWVCRS
jgi:arylsulfatase A-like enzyme